jgi:hypothetical protein
MLHPDRRMPQIPSSFFYLVRVVRVVRVYKPLHARGVKHVPAIIFFSRKVFALKTPSTLTTPLFIQTP